MAVGDQPCDQVDQEVDGAAMAGMLDLRDVFELISDRLDDGAFAEQKFVRPVEQTVVHLCAQFGDEVQPVGHQQLLGQRLREIAFGAFEFAHEACRQLRNGMSIIEVARGQAERQDLALIVDDQVQLEAIKPAHRGLATSGTPVKDAMGVDASVVADGKRGGVNEANACTLTQSRMQIGHQGHQHRGHQLDKARIAHQCWKLAAQMALHIFSVIGFERAIVRLVEQDENGHDLTWMHLGQTVALALSTGQQFLLPLRRKLLPEIIYRTKEFEYTHRWTLLGIDRDVCFVLSYQERFPYPELTLKYFFASTTSPKYHERLAILLSA